MILTLWIFIHDLSPFSLEWFKPKYSNFFDLWLWTWWKLLNSIFPIWKFQNLMKFGRDRRLNYRVYLDITLYLIYYYDLNLKESIKSTLLVSICGISTRLRMIAGPVFEGGNHKTKIMITWLACTFFHVEIDCSDMHF